MTRPMGKGLNEAIRVVEIEAERTLALLRIYAALIMTIPHIAHFLTYDADRQSGIRIFSLITLGTLLASGIITLVLIRQNVYRHWFQYGLAFFDAVMVALIAHLSLQFSGLSGPWVFATPIAWAVPLLLVVGALRYRPAIQAVSTLFFVGAIIIVLLTSPGGQPAGSLQASGPEHLAGFGSVISRVLLIALTGLATIWIMWRSRSLLLRVESEALSKAALARFLPAEIVPYVTEDKMAHGQRQHVAILFVDIRGSTRMAEKLDPFMVSELIASFRKIIHTAARQNGGMIDKFVGDGALVLFGAPNPVATDAAHSLQCGLDILRMVNEQQEALPAERRYTVGIGIHCGEVYCGVIGDDERREFTVIGDPVNVASRIEEATKTAGVPILASGEVVNEAGANGAWEVISCDRLRGRHAETTLMTPKVLAPVQN